MRYIELLHRWLAVIHKDLLGFGTRCQSERAVLTMLQAPPGTAFVLAAVVPTEQVGQFTMNKRGSKILPKPAGGLIMTTSIHDQPCAKAQGDFINALSVINKVLRTTARTLRSELLLLCSQAIPACRLVIRQAYNILSLATLAFERCAELGVPPH